MDLAPSIAMDFMGYKFYFLLVYLQFEQEFEPR